MTERTAMLVKLKPEGVDAYLEYHRNVWPELEAVYHAAGITDISCYVSGTTLVVTIEVDPTIHDEAKATLAENEVERAWQAEMLKLRDPSFAQVTLEEVYRLPQA